MGKKIRKIANFFLMTFIIILSFSVAFGIVELYVRYYNPQEVAPIKFMFDPQLGEIPPPKQKGRKIKPGMFDHTYSHNSLGLRGSREYGPEKKVDYRLLFLGDSFTYGFGMNDDQAFVYLTEKQLLAKHLSVEAINAGNSGRGTDYGLKFFQVLGCKLKPDLTVLGFLSNDFVDNRRQEYFSTSPAGEISPKSLESGRGIIKKVLFNLPGYNWLVSWSQAANLVKEAGVKLYLKTTDPKALQEGPLVIYYPETHKGYADQESKFLTEIYLKNLINTVKNSGSALMLCYFPIASEIDIYRKNGQISSDEAAFTNIAQSLGESIVSLTPLIAASAEPTDKLYFAVDGHWTVLGNALAAQCMAEQVERRLKNKLPMGQQ